MASKRDRIIELAKYFNSLGIEVNIGKNKAQGNKGFFKVIKGSFRIDICKGLSDEDILHTLVHEFAHYLHYINDNSLKSLDFFAGENWNELIEELIELTVDSIPKSTISPLFEIKNKLKTDIKLLETHIIEYSPEFVKNKPCKKIEDEITKAGYEHLLKYDKVKLFGLLGYKIISIENVKKISKEAELYLKLKSKERYMKRINSKISRLNRYYNTPTELFARALEMYVFKQELVFEKAPNFFALMEKNIVSNKFKQINKILQILILN